MFMVKMIIFTTILSAFSFFSYPDIGLGFEWKNIDANKETLDFLHIAGPNNFTMSSDNNLGQKRFWSSVDFNENILKL